MYKCIFYPKIFIISFSLFSSTVYFKFLLLSIINILCIFCTVCADPGTPLHGSRTVNSKDGGFSEGAIVSFQCNTNYKLIGAKKIVCSKGKWSEEKFAQCLLQGMWSGFVFF